MHSQRCSGKTPFWLKVRAKAKPNSKSKLRRLKAVCKNAVEEREVKCQEIERFKNYKNELVDLVNQKESQLGETQNAFSEIEKQLKNANFSLEKAS